MRVSLIITTYNRPRALELILKSLCHQTLNGFEVLVADDGSTESTQELVANMSAQMPYPIQHVWQADQGFRAAKIRNQAAVKACSDYLIFIDGDCVPRADFLSQHMRLAEKGCFVSGPRILLSPSFTEQVEAQQLPIARYSRWTWLKHRFQNHINRSLPLMNLPGKAWRFRKQQRWQGAKTCNLAVWKNDFLTVNGFDESYQGWGYEDSDLVIRLLRAGIRRKLGQYACIVYHLWHREHDRSQEPENLQRLKIIEQSQLIRAQIGCEQYL